MLSKCALHLVPAVATTAGLHVEAVVVLAQVKQHELVKEQVAFLEEDLRQLIAEEGLGHPMLLWPVPPEPAAPLLGEQHLGVVGRDGSIWSSPPPKRFQETE